MFINWSEVKVFIKPGSTDMRKQINGLSILIEELLGEQIFSGSLFIFCNKPRDILKILYWNNNGFCLWLKRLEKDKFPWPKNEEDVFKITTEELKMLLSGIDFFNAHKKLKYSKAS